MLIFLPFLLLGLFVALLTSHLKAKAFHIPQWKAGWLVLIALLLMALAVPPVKAAAWVPSAVTARILLTSSQILLLVFVVLNLRIRGMFLLGLGFFLNFVCMQANGGFMPVQPDRIAYLLSDPAMDTQPLVGFRYAQSKDIVLEKEQTRLWLLGDHLTLPTSIPYRVIFSLGDIIMGLGIFYALVGMSSGDVIRPLGVPYEYHET